MEKIRLEIDADGGCIACDCPGSVQLPAVDEQERIVR
jgi:hypothetical protein